MDPEKETGLPDLAVYFPAGDVQWRFIELKRLRTEGRVKAESNQAKWLDLLATHLGPESAIEWIWDEG